MIVKLNTLKLKGKIVYKLGVAVVLLLLASCKDYNIKIDQDMRAEAQQMEVKGRQGFTFNQKVRFGEFHTDRVRRGWTRSYDIPFMIRFQGAQEKLSFSQFDGEGRQVVVSAIGKFQSKEVPLLGAFFGIPLEYKHYFAGTIYAIGSGNAYDFIVFNPESNFKLMPTEGHISGPGLSVNVHGVTQLDDRRLWNIDNLGFEYKRGERSIGAVQIFNNGKVWLRKGLEEEHRLVLAGLSTALMIRNNELGHSTVR